MFFAAVAARPSVGRRDPVPVELGRVGGGGGRWDPVPVERGRGGEQAASAQHRPRVSALVPARVRRLQHRLLGHVLRAVGHLLRRRLRRVVIVIRPYTVPAPSRRGRPSTERQHKVSSRAYTVRRKKQLTNFCLQLRQYQRTVTPFLLLGFVMSDTSAGV